MWKGWRKALANIRGRLVPVLDVRFRFRLATRPASPSDHLVVADAGGRTFALRVDRAIELVRFDPSERGAANRADNRRHAMNWTVGQKIGAGFAVPLVVLLAVGGVAYYSIGRLVETAG